MSTQTYNKPHLQDGSELSLLAYHVGHASMHQTGQTVTSSIAGRMGVLPSTWQTNVVEQLFWERMREFECMSVIEQ